VNLQVLCGPRCLRGPARPGRCRCGSSAHPDAALHLTQPLAGADVDSPRAMGRAGGVHSKGTYPGLVRGLRIGGFTKIRADPAGRHLVAEEGVPAFACRIEAHPPKRAHEVQVRVSTGPTPTVDAVSRVGAVDRPCVTGWTAFRGEGRRVRTRRRRPQRFPRRRRGRRALVAGTTPGRTGSHPQ
jgi:hypothetical protein